MADPHDGREGREGRLETPDLTGGDEGGNGVSDYDNGTEAVIGIGGELSQPAMLKEGSSEPMEEGRRLVEADQRDGRGESEEPETVLSLGNFSDHGMHAVCDLEESRTLQMEDGRLSTSVELSRAISNMVGSGSIDRHLVTWEKIDLILASIPGARSSTTNNTTTKLKVRDFRKIHIQETLNINLSSRVFSQTTKT